MPILPGLLAPVVGPPASQFLIYYSATTATVLARIFPPFKSGLLLSLPPARSLFGEKTPSSRGERREATDSINEAEEEAR